MTRMDANHLFDRAADLVVHEDRNVHVWLGGTLLVEFALAVAALVVLAWADQVDGWTVLGLALVALVAVVLALAGTAGALRHVERQRAAAAAAGRVETADGAAPATLFTDDHERQAARLSRVIRRARWGVVAVWLIFAAVLVVSWYTQPPVYDDAGTTSVSL